MERRDNSSALSNHASMKDNTERTKAVTLLPRTAIVIRTWWDHQYSVEDIIYLRSMIAELSLSSGGEYTIHFLVHVKDDNVPIWGDRKIYDRVLENSLPAEFRGMGILWSERQMGLIYGGLQESSSVNYPCMASTGLNTWLCNTFPISIQSTTTCGIGKWTSDILVNGTTYSTESVGGQETSLEKVSGNEMVGFTYLLFTAVGKTSSRWFGLQTELGNDSPNNVWSGLKGGTTEVPGFSQGRLDKNVWGPEGPADMLAAQDDPVPPTTFEKDKYTWGVGEEADFIT